MPTNETHETHINKTMNLSLRVTSLITGAAALYFLALIPTTAQAAPPQYTVTILGDLGGDYAYARDINDSGQIVGEAATVTYEEKAVFWNANTPGTPIVLSSPAGFDSRDIAYAINASGQIVGYATSQDYEGIYHTTSVLWNANTPAVSGIPVSAGGSCLNDLGLAAGLSIVGNVNTPAGNVTTLSAAANAPVHPVAYAYGINSSGLVVGHIGGIGPTFADAVVWDSNTGVATSLQSLGPIMNSSGARSINDHGIIAGYSVADPVIGGPPALPYAVTWDVNTGTPTILGQIFAPITVAAPGVPSLADFDINNLGDVIGSVAVTVGSPSLSSFLYTDGTMYDLNSLLVPGSDVILLQATAINNSRQIVGSGRIGGHDYAILLNPVETPEPSTTFLLLGGTALLAIRRRRSPGGA